MKIRVIVNQRSGAGVSEEVLTVLKEKFDSCAAPAEARSARHAGEIARQAARDHIDTIAVVGGDGTVNAVLNGIVGTDVALGIIPTGTANDLASLYDIPRAVSEACDVILERRVKRIDVITVNGRHYVTAGGLGFPCAVVRVANAAKHRIGMGRGAQRIFGARLYQLLTLHQAVKKIPSPTPVRIHWNRGTVAANSFALFVNNQSFLGKHFVISPQAVNDDGMFDICLIEELPGRTQILSMILKSCCSQLRSPRVKTWQASNLVLETAEPMKFFGDGEVFERASKFRIEIRPRAVDIVAPNAKRAEGSC